MPDKQRVVITGMGAVTPLGVGAQLLHERWAAGVVGIEDGVGACSSFIPSDHLSTKEIRRLDRFAQLGVAASDEALKQAGWDVEKPYDPMRISTVFATGIGGISTIEANHDVMRDVGAHRVSPLGVAMYMPNAGAAAISMRYGLRGQSYGVVAACASGGQALGLAARAIQYGDADAALVGGAESALTEFGFSSFRAMQALSDSGISRPFDARRDGFVMGEGAGVLVLEERDAAIRRGATILGELVGFGATSDAHHLTAPDPTARAAAQAMTLALRDAGATPADISYVNAHGTSTELNDAAETRALKLALGEYAYRIPISSTKSSIGHLLGAAGVVEAIATVEALNARLIPATLGLEIPGEGLDLDYVPGSARELTPVDGHPPLALSNSFAFGGHNVTLAIRGQG